MQLKRTEVGAWRIQRGVGGKTGSAATVTTRSQSGGLKHLLTKAREASEDPDFKLNTQKTKITASGPVT